VNRIITIIGGGLVILGLIFSFVPLINGPSKVLTPAQSIVGLNATRSIALSPDWTIGVSWTSNQPVSLLVLVCEKANTSAATFQSVCPGASLAVQNGTSGSGTYGVPFGGTIFVGIISNTSHGLRVNVQFRPAQTVLGTILTIGGAGVTVVGLFPARKRRPPTGSPVEPPP
jgi:hypothetical protein